MKNKVSMWFLFASAYLMQIPFLAYFISAMINEEVTENDLFVGFILALSCGLALITVILGVLNLVFAVMGFKREVPSPYKTTMIIKLCMIPFYIINFVIWGLFVAVCLMFPYFIFIGIVLFIVSLISTYGIVLSTGSHNIVCAIKDFKHTKNLIYLLCAIGHFFFCIDVVSAIVLCVKGSPERIGEETFRY